MNPFNFETIESFLNDCESRSFSPDTLRAYRGDLMSLLHTKGRQSEPEGLREAMFSWLNDGRRMWAPRTTNRKLASAKSLCKFLGEPKLLDGYQAPTPERAVPHPLPAGLVDLKAMMDATTDVHRRALLALCGLCGLRISEAMNVKPSDFDRKTRTLRVRSGKGGKDRVLPVSEGAWEHLMPCVEITDADTVLLPWSDRGARMIITDLGVVAGVERRVSSHDLRSTLLSELYWGTKDLRLTQEYAGHASSATTEIYTAVRADDMRAGVNALAF